MDDLEKRNIAREFTKSTSLQIKIYAVKLEESSFHAIFDYFARCYEDDLDETMIGIVDRISQVYNVLEMKNIFDCFIRKRTEHVYKRTGDQWSNLQCILESRLAELINKIDPDDPDLAPDFFELLKSGDTLISKFITKRASQVLYSKAARVAGALSGRLEKTV